MIGDAGLWHVVTKAANGATLGWYMANSDPGLCTVDVVHHPPPVPPVEPPTPESVIDRLKAMEVDPTPEEVLGALRDAGLLRDEEDEDEDDDPTGGEHLMLRPDGSDLRWRCTNALCGWTASEAFGTDLTRGASWYRHHKASPVLA